MSDDADADQRTLPPTPKRLADARQEGQVPRAKELTTLFVISGFLLFLTIGGAHIIDRTRAMMRSAFVLTRDAAFNPEEMPLRLHFLGIQAALAYVPLMLVVAIAAVLGLLAVGGWNYTTKTLSPNFNRLNPISGIGRMLSWHSLAELAKASVAATVLGAITAQYLAGHMPDFLSLVSGDPIANATMIGHWVVAVIGLLVLPLIVIGGLDAGFTIWNYLRGLRMTPEEVKRESRESEGSPEVKGRIRSQQRAMARRRMMAAVPGASVVVTNPTHYAVALSYVEGSMRAPKVVAKGVDMTAARIRDIANESGVLLVEAPPLARALYANSELEDEIPAALYNAVAQVLAYVYQVRAGLANAALGDLEVPAALDPAEQGKA